MNDNVKTQFRYEVPEPGTNEPRSLVLATQLANLPPEAVISSTASQDDQLTPGRRYRLVAELVEEL